jgi:Tol biopolymer transport system component
MRRALIIIIFICCAAKLINCDNPANSDGKGWRYPEDDMGVSPVYTVRAWHPLSQWIIVTAMDSVDTDNDGNNDYFFLGPWLLNAETLEKKPLNMLKHFRNPSWSRDGKKLVMERGGQIYSVKVPSIDPIIIDTTTITQLTFEGRNYLPCWSPDGEWIAFDSNLNDPVGANVIWKMRKDGSQKTDLSEHEVGEWRMPNWSPDGKRIAFKNYVTQGGEIYTMDINGGNIKRLTKNTHFDSYPKYSPDGKKIAYMAKPQNSSYHIRIMNSNGTSNLHITPEYSLGFDWSPDGSKIVFTYSTGKRKTPGDGDLWMINADGTGWKRLTFEIQ